MHVAHLRDGFDTAYLLRQVDLCDPLHAVGCHLPLASPAGGLHGADAASDLVLTLIERESLREPDDAVAITKP